MMSYEFNKIIEESYNKLLLNQRGKSRTFIKNLFGLKDEEDYEDLITEAYDRGRKEEHSDMEDEIEDAYNKGYDEGSNEH